MNHDATEQDDRELRDPALGRALRTALGDARAPEAWVNGALAAAREHRVVDLPREPLLPVLLPYVSGGLVVTGCAVGFTLQAGFRARVGEAVRDLPRLLASIPAPAAGSENETLWMLCLATPLVVALILESTRGFSDVKRWLR